MGFEFSPRARELRQRLLEFMERHVYPQDARYWAELDAASDRWAHVPLVETLKEQAQWEGLWNLFLPNSEHGAGLSNLDYAPLAEIMGGVLWASEVFNCSPPDTGNMEMLQRFGTAEQQRQWLEPLLAGTLRSAFAMTEPDVVSSDATNIQSSMRRDGDHYVINGHKWFVSGACGHACRLLIVMVKSDPNNPDLHKQQSMILVPRDTPGITIKRSLTVLGYDDAPHGHAEILFEDVRVPVENILLGEGRGFEIAQGRLGPGRIHHCMRSIGLAEVALALTCRRLSERKAFGQPLVEQSLWKERIAEARILIDQARLLTLNAADVMDKHGNKVARKEIAMIKVAAPHMLGKVVDWAIQAHGAAGVTDDFGLGRHFARYRGLRLLDGPDEVHRNQIARIELSQQRRSAVGAT